MKKNFSGMFMLLAILMQFLHTLRGPELTFIIDGQLPYILYYGIMASYVICLLCYLYDLFMFSRKKR